MRSCSRAHLHAKCCHDRPEPADLVRFPGPSPPTGSDRRAGPPGRYIKDVFVQCALCCRASVQTSRVKQVSAFRSDLMAIRDPGRVRGRRPRNKCSRSWQRKVVWIYFGPHGASISGRMVRWCVPAGAAQLARAIRSPLGKRASPFEGTTGWSSIRLEPAWAEARGQSWVQAIRVSCGAYGSQCVPQTRRGGAGPSRAGVEALPTSRNSEPSDCGPRSESHGRGGRGSWFLGQDPLDPCLGF